jgi:hypothetical protein
MRRALTTLPSWREPVLRGGHRISEFTIVTYQHKPGRWRAANTPKARSENFVPGEVCSVVTPDDYESEVQSRACAEKLIRTLMRR